MANKATTRSNIGKKKNVSKQELKRRIITKLITRGVSNPDSATDEQLYHATVHAIKDIMVEYRNDFKKRAKASGAKKICYLCMEFLVGRSLKNDTVNLGIYDTLSNILSEFGTSFERIYACEVDPGLGNGGLGRLAACFMDSLSALDYSSGSSICSPSIIFCRKSPVSYKSEYPFAE